MAKFSIGRSKRFRISTRVFNGRVGIYSPGIKRAKRKAVRVVGVKQMVK